MFTDAVARTLELTLVAMQGSMHWSRLFTRMINSEVKLVGPTITCSNPPTVSVNDTMPYVQFNALATDQVYLLTA